MKNSISGKIRVTHLLYFILIYSLLFVTIRDFFHIPSFTRYFMDIFLIIGLLFTYKTDKIKIVRSKYFYKFFCFYILYLALSYIVLFQSPFYFINGLMRLFRFYLFFMLCVIWMKKEDVDKIIKILKYLFYINFFVTLYQYFILNINGDYLGGIFGISKGCNGYSNIFLIVWASVSLMDFIHNRKKLWNVIIDIVMILIIAVLASIKFFFIEFMIAGLIIVFYTKFSFKKLFFLILSSLALLSCMYLLTIVFPNDRQIFTVDEFLNYAGGSGYNASGSINRSTFMDFVNDNFLTDGFSRLFGLGLGNCDYSGMDLMTSQFYINNFLTRYYWFSSAHVYLEQGLIGLVLYLSFFGYITICSLRYINKNSIKNYYYGIAIIIALESIVVFLYNQSMTQESAYIMYFLMALPFMKHSSCIENKD